MVSGQLVIAELTAFRAVLLRAQRGEGEVVRAWSRSTITNALHRVGPVASLSVAAQRASARAGALAEALTAAERSDPAVAREAAVEALDAMIEAIRCLKERDDGLPLS